MSPLEAIPPSALVGARRMAHLAVQTLTRTSLGNLRPEADDSHTNLGWDSRLGALLTHPMPTTGGSDLSVGLELGSMALLIVRDGTASARLDLGDLSPDDALSWLDEQLGVAGLEKASAATLHYELPQEVAGIEVYSTRGTERELAALAGWFSLAGSLLETFAGEHSEIDPGPGPVRCWPHHFDIATYVRLEDGDVDTAKGIGVGLSPGDGSYPQPYFYVTPFPAPDVAQLPPAPAPGHWHDEGFVGAIATGDEILTLAEIPSGAADFIREAFAVGRGVLR